MNRMKLRKSIYISRIDKIIYVSIIIAIVTYIFINNFDKRSMNILLNYAENETIKVSTIIINKSISKILKNKDYFELIDIEKNTDDEIISVNFNNYLVNKALVELNDDILNSISILKKEIIDELDLKYFNSKDLIYYVPIGVIYDMPILVDLGPKIPYKTNLLGSIDSSITTNATYYGINNALIEVSLNISLNIQVILPFTSKNVNIIKNIPLDSKIIQGKIPQYYGGLINNTSS